MLVRKADLAAKYGISVDRLDFYELAGLLKPIGRDDQVCYAGELRVAVIAKAEHLGFTFAEIGTLLSMADDKLGRENAG